VTGSNAADAVSATVKFFDPDLNDRPTAIIDAAHQAVTYQDASGHVFGLTLAQVATFESGLHIAAEAGNSNSGKIDWNYLVADKQLDFLGVGETLTIATPLVVDDHHGGTVTENVVVTINGTNDRPVANADSNGVSKGGTLLVCASGGVLASDSDADVHDNLVVGAVNGSAANVGHVVSGTYGSLTLDADGGYIYAANKGALPSQTVAQDEFNYTISDGHGGTDASTLSIIVFNPDVVYQSGTNTTLTGANGKNALDGSTGHDVLVGGGGADVLIGGNGNTLTGGLGPDTFVFRSNFGTNVITDFNMNNDVIQFDRSLFASTSDVFSHATNTPSSAMITDNHGDSVTLLGVTLAQLQGHQGDFHLT
jgi:VCBS repeat-containing protein